MPSVVINNLKGKTIHCEQKTKRLLDILLSATDWMHACGGKGRCITCKVIVKEGKENLSEVTPAETRFMNLDKLQENERLACQAFVSGDVCVVTPAEYQLPHLKYEE